MTDLWPKILQEIMSEVHQSDMQRWLGVELFSTLYLCEHWRIHLFEYAFTRCLTLTREIAKKWLPVSGISSISREALICVHIHFLYLCWNTHWLPKLYLKESSYLFQTFHQKAKTHVILISSSFVYWSYCTVSSSCLTCFNIFFIA